MLTSPDTANVTILQIIYSQTPVFDNSLLPPSYLGVQPTGQGSFPHLPLLFFPHLFHLKNYALMSLTT